MTGVVGDDDELAVGFLGAGFISAVHEMFLSRVPGHRIVAVHDPDQARAEAMAARHGADVVDEDELLERVDAVYVASWTSEHPRLVARAAAAGRAVFCEKPLAVDAAAVDGMVEAVQAAGVVNQVGLVLRFSPPFRLVHHLLADERAGRVLAVSFRDDQFLPVQGQYGSTWRIDAARAGRGAMLEHSIHDVDLLRWLLGPVTSASAVTRSYHGHHRIDDVAAARFEFASGAVANLTSVWHDILERPSMRHVEVFCERLHVVVEGDVAGPVRWQLAGAEPRMLEGEALLADLRSRGDRRSNPARSFLDAVRAGTPADPDFAAAVPAHRIVDAVYRSADEGGTVVADPEAAPR
jgi:predicted dehydrogenase